MDNINHLKAWISAALGLLTALWGWFGWLLLAWITLMMVDIFTGMAAALRNGEWASSVARDGLWHKLGSIVAVGVTGILDLVMGQLLSTIPDALPFTYTTFLCPLLLVWYLLTEAGSILENADKLGAPIPGWLRLAVAALKKQVDESAPHEDEEKSDD